MNSCREDADIVDALIRRRPSEMHDVENDRRAKVESVDASVARTGWPIADDRVVMDANNRRRKRGSRSKSVRTAPHLEMSPTTSTARSRQSSKCGACVRSFLTFLFSTIGLTILLVVYCVVGAVVFMELESEKRVFVEPDARDQNRTAAEIRESVVTFYSVDSLINCTVY